MHRSLWLLRRGPCTLLPGPRARLGQGPVAKTSSLLAESKSRRDLCPIPRGSSEEARAAGKSRQTGSQGGGAGLQCGG